MEFVRQYHQYFSAHASDSDAFAMKKYMRNQFEFLGIRSPQRKAWSRAFLKQHPLPPKQDLGKITKAFWQLPAREFQYVGMELWLKYKKQIDEDDLPLFEYMITNQSWWDTVDFIAPNLVGSLFLKSPSLIKPSVHRWLATDNIWLKRTAILFQLKYKAQTDLDLLFEIIKKNKDSQAFFIQKAIGWVLRENAKRIPETIKQFVDNQDLAPLSKREALKHFK